MCVREKERECVCVFMTKSVLCERVYLLKKERVCVYMCVRV